MFDYIVIGKGLIGSAAARYLSMRGRTAVIGPDEPPDLQTHEGVFASHYDQGRITRQLSRDEVWAALARMSIEQYAALEAESGIRFHYPVGGLYAPTAAEASSYLAEMAGLAERVAVDYEVMDEAVLRGRWPYLRFPDGWGGLYETAPAGYINPRRLIRAQLAAGQKQGLEIVRETVTSLKSSPDYLTVMTDAGQVYRTKKMLVATGAVLQEMMPGLAALAWRTGRCVVTYTTQGRPYIGLAGDGRIGVAVGGNGSGAKSSDGIGRLGAELLADGRWSADLAEALFRPDFGE